MNTEDLLTVLFADEADRRPESAEVLDAVHQRIARRGRITGSRAASAIGAAVAVAAIAVTATVVTTSSDHRTDPAVGAAPATTAPTTPASSAPPTHSPSSTNALTHTATPRRNAPSANNGGSGYSTINAGWLPGPAKQDPIGTSRRPGFEERDWDVTVDGVAMDVIIWTESGSLPSRMQATGGKADYQHLIVNGHPGRKFVGTNATIVAFDLGNGRIAYVGPSVRQTTAKVTSARIAKIAVKVARNMQFNRHDPIPAR